MLQRRLQNNNNSPLSHHGSDSPQSLDSAQSRVSSTTARASLREHLKQKQQLNLKSHLINSSNEDLLADKSLQNAMLQDVATFKKQLVQLRRILQEVSEFDLLFFVYFSLVAKFTNLLIFTHIFILFLCSLFIVIVNNDRMKIIC